MGYRGSKSNYIKFVKEQRVDGSCMGLLNCSMLRCTLKGFERITYNGIPSNQILNKQLYSTIKTLKNHELGPKSELYTNNDKSLT